MKKELIQNLRQKGLRITPLLKTFLDIFCKADSPLSVINLITELKKERLSPNKTTLYRKLEQLTEIGILQENIFSDTIKRYCLRHESHHHHFVCGECGFIKDVKIKSCSEITKKLASKLKNEGHVLNEHIMTFSGTCSKCLTV